MEMYRENCGFRDEWGQFTVGNPGGPGRPRGKRAEPSPERSNGRDAHGRFSPGNPGGPGKPAHKASKWRGEWAAARIYGNAETAAAMLLEAVEAGESWAIKQCFRSLF